MTDPAAPPADQPDTPTLPPPPPPPVDPDNPLGPPGEKALEAFKERARLAEAEVKRLALIEAEFNDLRSAQMSEHDRALEQARLDADAAARADVLGAVNERLFVSEVRLAARAELPAADGKTVRLSDPSLLDDPEVARRLLGLAEIPVTPTGDIDAEAISAAVAALAASKPSLTASATPPAGSADQGARTPPAPKDLDAQIVEAEGKGDWATAGQLKLHKLAASPRP